VILCSVLQHVTGDPQSRQFMIGDQKVIPNISGVFHRGSPVGLYLQIYNAGTDQTTLRPALEVEYALLKDGREIERQVEDWRTVKTNGERLTLSRMIDSHVLTPGVYAIELRVRDRVTGQTLTQKEKFTITP